MKASIIVNILFCCGTIILILTHLAISDYLSQGEGSTHWSGALLSTSGSFYTNIPCNTRSPKICKGFVRLWQAGIVLLSFDLASALTLLFYCYKLLKLFNNSKVSNKLVLCLCVGGCSLHLIGYVLWLLLAGGRFDRSCKATYKDSESARVCCEVGAQLGLIVIAVMIAQIGLIIFFYPKQSKAIAPLELDEPNTS